jgi:hypothetical protein
MSTTVYFDAVGFYVGFAVEMWAREFASQKAAAPRLEQSLLYVATSKDINSPKGSRATHPPFTTLLKRWSYYFVDYRLL